jgi:DNA-binding transcriptional ArsR family regulator
MNGQILPNNNILDELIKKFDSKFFKTLSEPVRIQILRFLIQSGRLDISTIAENMPQDRSVVSIHLNLMYEAGMVGEMRDYEAAKIAIAASVEI